MTDCDIAVIGYGPTGMALAALLGAIGHKVVVLERYSGLYNLPRAACFDDEIMRTFQLLGIVDDLAGGVVAQDEYDWVNANGETLVKLTYDKVAPGGWPALFMMYQPYVETVLDRHDKALSNVEIRQGFTVMSMKQDASGVTLNASGPDDMPTSLHARFVIGADGANGFARRTLCEDSSDYGFEENWLVCDFELKRTVEGLPLFRQICDPAQPTSIVRIGPDHHRFSFMLEPDESPERAVDADRVWSRVAKYLSKQDAVLIRAVNYVFRSRIVENWRHGRVFLAGDAAHEMPPFLGQGMCSGIRDAHNLAWKLDLVITGRADMSLMDTYQSEREPHVRFITEKAIELGRVQTLRDPEAARQRDERFLALRRAQQAPEKVNLPPLTRGLIANDGSFFPQGRVRLGDRCGLFDDLIGYGWCLVTSEPGFVEHLTPAQQAFLDRLGGRTASFSPGGAHLEDTDGIYASWFDAHGCKAALVRPDWYVYGSVTTPDELSHLLDDLARRLNGDEGIWSGAETSNPPFGKQIPARNSNLQGVL